MSSSPHHARRGSTHRAVVATLAVVLASALCLAAASPADAAEPVEDMGCRMLIWASDSVFDTSYAHDGMRHTFRGCLVKRGWSTNSPSQCPAAARETARKTSGLTASAVCSV